MYGAIGRTHPLPTRASTGDDAVEPTGRADAAAFRKTYAEHSERVWRFLARLGVPPSDLEDLLQEVFVVVHRRLPEFDGAVPFSTWLFAIAFRIAKNHRRWRWRHRLARLVGLEEGWAGADPERELDRKEAASELSSILERIESRKRAVLVLYELEGLDGPAIARIVGCPVHTVWSRLRAGREDFKRLVRRRQALSGRGEP